MCVKLKLPVNAFIKPDQASMCVKLKLPVNAFIKPDQTKYILEIIYGLQLDCAIKCVF